MNRDELLPLSTGGLMDLLQHGHALTPEQLAGNVYRGISLGLPAWIERLTWKTFRKVFVADEARGAVRGWNERLQQRGLDAPSEPILKRGVPLSFGHFEVLPADRFQVPHGCESGVVLDYAAGQPGWHPMARLRDPMVALKADSNELLLGWSFVSLGATRVSTPSFFLLERECAVHRVVEPEHWRGTGPRTVGNRAPVTGTERSAAAVADSPR